MLPKRCAPHRTPKRCARNGRAILISSRRHRHTYCVLAPTGFHLMMQATLQTARLILRSFCEDDLDLFVRFFANEGFIRFSAGNFSRERVAEFVDRVIG